jgi:hypothetical protein
MEYTFRNSFAEEPCSIHLNDTSISFQLDGKENLIPYNRILEVQLIRQSRNVYKTVIKAHDRPEIIITNKFYTQEKVYEDRSRVYSTFIRVLHFHLKDKSKANFFTGKHFSTIWFWMACSVCLSFVISYIAHYLGLGLANPIVQGVVLAVLIGIFIVAINVSHRARHYQPTDIPLEFLP